MLSVLIVSCWAMFASIECQPVPFVTRAQWNARNPTSTTFMASPVSNVWIHHGAAGTGNTRDQCAALMRSYQNTHMNTNGWADIGYNFGACNDGSIFEGRGWNTLGAHTSGYNSNSIGICFLGDYTSTGPTAAAYSAVQQWISWGVSQGKIRSNYALGGHRDVVATTCPGNPIYNTIRGWTGFAYGK